MEDRVLAGVADGLARHLRLAPFAVRAGFLALALVKGFGILLYAAYWVVVPEQPAAGGAARRAGGGPARLVTVAILAGGLLLLVEAFRPALDSALFYSALLAACGVALLWWQADEAQRVRLLEMTSPGSTTPRARLVAVARLGGGVVLMAVGLAAVLLRSGGFGASRQAVLATTVIVTGILLVTGPWWWRVVRLLAAERRERIRSQERADVAAHLHDSVLHTLALIQRHADSPREVARLARGQERELRAWLYRPAPDVGQRFAATVEDVAASVEDAYAVTVESVVVGDTGMDERLGALVQATREALVNAARHAGTGEVSLYAEVESAQTGPQRVCVYVRDRGRGFDPAEVPDDRHGIRGSVVGRVRRHGGTATVRSAPGEGTEVELSMELGG